MFKKITVKNGIKTTDGRVLHHNNTYSFSEGITAIVGPNGCGKSLLSEFCAFSLFGVCALRLSSEHYKGLGVDAEVDIRGKTYLINRTINSCIIYMKDDKGLILEVCKGTKACNEYIIKLLGYNYQVYSMGNYAAQGEISDFCKLKPSERKGAIDKVLGLGIIDQLIKAASDSGKTYLDEANGMERVLGPEPEEPTKPDTGGLTEEQISDYLKNIQTLIDRKNVVKGILSKIGTLTEPVKPTKPEGYVGSDIIRSMLSKKTYCEEELTHINGFQKPTESRDYLKNIPLEWEAHRAYLKYKSQLASMPKEKPSIPLEEALNGCTDWYNYNLYIAKKQAFEKESVTCPACGNRFSPNNKWEDPKQIPNRPEKEENFYKSQVELHHIWENFEEPEPVEEVACPKYTETQAANLLNIFDLYEDGQKRLPEILKEYETCKNVTQQDLLRDQEYENALLVYQPSLEMYQNNLIEYNKYSQELAQLEGLGDLENARTIYTNFLMAISSYNNLLHTFEVAKKDYKNKLKEIEKCRDIGERYKKAADNLKEMKVKIKRYVIPSLQKVSSRLLFEMSDGLYSSIEIDDDFNITSGGLDVAAYSGSEKDMINLSIRIGLGQVLTHRAFNVFIGDEIDAAMSQERAQLVTNCLGRLRNYIKQIILISHRQITADNYIELN